MGKETKLLIGMCLADKETFHANDFAIFLNLKYTEGIYPYLKTLLAKNFIKKTERGEYILNEENQKVQDMLFITEITGDKAETLFTKHAKMVLEKFQ